MCELAQELLGSQLGAYRIDAHLGSGGVGVVFRAWDTQAGRTVALKVLRSEVLSDDSARRRFKREARALERVSHANIGEIYEFGTSDHRDYLVMEFVPGRNLAEMLRDGPLAPLDVARLGEQLARGLGAAHSAGVIHRDVKPANLRVTPAGHLKLLDFGVALPTCRLAAGVTSTTLGGTIVGTLPYMAPEQLLGERIDERADVYSAGAVLFEMACGRPVFPESQVCQLIDAILHRVPLRPRARGTASWPGLDGIILKALKKRRDQRFESAGDLAQALHELRPRPAGRRTGRRIGRRSTPDRRGDVSTGTTPPAENQQLT